VTNYLLLQNWHGYCFNYLYEGETLKRGKEMNNSNSILIGDAELPSKNEVVEAVQNNRAIIAAWTCLVASAAALLTAINFAFF